MNGETHVLDSCSLIAYLREKPGNETVANLFAEAAAKAITVVMHKVTLTEVLYDMLRTDKTKAPADLLADIRLLPITLTDTLSDAFVSMAAYFKANHKISFGDCFVLALAKEYNAAIVTSDRHEFEAIEKIDEVKFVWIR